MQKNIIISLIITFVVLCACSFVDKKNVTVNAESKTTVNKTQDQPIKDLTKNPSVQRKCKPWDSCK